MSACVKSATHLDSIQVYGVDIFPKLEPIRRPRSSKINEAGDIPSEREKIKSHDRQPFHVLRISRGQQVAACLVFSSFLVGSLVGSLVVSLVVSLVGSLVVSLVVSLVGSVGDRCALLAHPAPH